jgi:hypothetical protein
MFDSNHVKTTSFTGGSILYGEERVYVDAITVVRTQYTTVRVRDDVAAANLRPVSHPSPHYKTGSLPATN